MSNFRFLSLLFVIASLLISCSSRQAFETDYSLKEKNWWQCDPKSEREWRCSDGQNVEETTDAILASAENSSEIVQESISEPVQTTEDISNEVISLQQQLIAEQQSDITQETTEVAVEVQNSEPEPLTIQELQQQNLGQSAAEQVSTEEVDEVIEESPLPIDGDWTIQLAAFSSEREATDFANGISGGEVITAIVSGRTFYRVTAGRFQNKKAAQEAATKLQKENSNLSTWVRKVD